MCKTDSQWEAADNRELSPALSHDSEGWGGAGEEVQEGGNVRKHATDSRCCTTETDTTL